MDANNYVMDNGDGTFALVVNGQTIYSQTDKETAENGYNNMVSPSPSLSPQDWISRGGSAYGTTTYANGNPSGGYSSGGGGSSAPVGNTNISDVFRARTESNQIDLNEKMREWDQAHALDRERFGLSQQQFEEQRRQYGLSLMTNFAQSLLNGATQLRGPGDWMQYAQYTGGGRDIFNQLTGGATPAFGAPTGYSKPAGITDILKQIGMPNLGEQMNAPARESQQGWYNSIQTGYERLKAQGQPWTREAYQRLMADQGVNPDVAGQIFDKAAPFFQQYGKWPGEQEVTAWLGQMQPGWRPTLPGLGANMPGGTGGNDDADLDAIWAGRPDLAQHYQQNGWDVSTPEKQRAAVRNWLTYPGNAGKTPAQVRQELGLGASAPVAPTPPLQGGLLPSPPGDYPIGPPSQPEQPQNWLDPVMEPDASIQGSAAQGLMQGATGFRQSPQIGTPTSGDNVKQDFLMGEGRGGWMNPNPQGMNPIQPTRGNIDPNVWNALTPDAQALYNSQGYLVNDPHQVNIANWNAMSPTAQQATLGAVEGGLTKSGAWNRDDWLRQMYNAAPKGQAPRRVQTNWGTLNSGY